MDKTAVIAVIAAVVGPLVAYLTAVRRLSGKIGTSDAAELWAESGKIRDDYRSRLSSSDIRTAALEERVAKLEQLNNDLARENINLTSKVHEYEQTILELRARLESLERENTRLRDDLAALRQTLKERGADA